MELWKQIDWTHQPKRSAVGAFARMFRVKLGKQDALDAIGPALSRSRFWIGFTQKSSVYWAMDTLVEHLVEAYGLEVVMQDGALQNLGLEKRWELPDDPKQGARAMAALKRAEPRLEPRPYVKNGASETLGWAVLSSLDWAELEAADLYATRALFPLKRKVPARPKAPSGPAPRRPRDPEHEALLAWIGENKVEMMPQLVEALDKLETAHPGSTQERDAASQVYRIGRRARR